MAKSMAKGKDKKKVDWAKLQPKTMTATEAKMFPSKIRVPMTGEAKGECLVVDLEMFFERMHRQGWAGVERKKI